MKSILEKYYVSFLIHGFQCMNIYLNILKRRNFATYRKAINFICNERNFMLRGRNSKSITLGGEFIDRQVEYNAYIEANW